MEAIHYSQGELTKGNGVAWLRAEFQAGRLPKKLSKNYVDLNLIFFLVAFTWSRRLSPMTNFSSTAPRRGQARKTCRICIFAFLQPCVARRSHGVGVYRCCDLTFRVQERRQRTTASTARQRWNASVVVNYKMSRTGQRFCQLNITLSHGINKLSIG